MGSAFAVHRPEIQLFILAARYGSLLDFGFLKFAKRNTFLIDPAGKVAKVYLGVNPARDTDEVASDLNRLATI